MQKYALFICKICVSLYIAYVAQICTPHFADGTVTRNMWLALCSKWPWLTLSHLPAQHACPSRDKSKPEPRSGSFRFRLQRLGLWNSVESAITVNLSVTIRWQCKITLVVHQFINPVFQGGGTNYYKWTSFSILEWFGIQGIQSLNWEVHCFTGSLNIWKVNLGPSFWTIDRWGGTEDTAEEVLRSWLGTLQGHWFRIWRRTQF